MHLGCSLFVPNVSRLQFGQLVKFIIRKEPFQRQGLRNQKDKIKKENSFRPLKPFNFDRPNQVALNPELRQTSIEFFSDLNWRCLMANNPPEVNFRLGNVNATVWCNDDRNGNGNRKFRTIQLEQRYKEEDSWKSSNRFTFDQLLRLRVCIDKAIAYISEKEM